MLAAVHRGLTPLHAPILLNFALISTPGSTGSGRCWPPAPSPARTITGVRLYSPGSSRTRSTRDGACRTGRAPTRSGPGYVNVRCHQEEETPAWRWVGLRWRYDGKT